MDTRENRLWLNVDELQKRLGLRPGVFVIGRSPAECDIVLVHQSVSRVHCLLIIGRRRIRVRDLGSRNGLRVNRRRVRSAQLHAGDRLRIGSLHCRLETAQESESVSPNPDAVTIPDDSDVPLSPWADLHLAGPEGPENSQDQPSPGAEPSPHPKRLEPVAAVPAEQEEEADDRMRFLDLDLEEEDEDAYFLGDSSELEPIDDDYVGDSGSSSADWMAPLRPLLLPAAVLTGVLMLLITAFFLWPDGEDDRELQMRLAQLLTAAQAPLADGRSEQPRLPPAEQQELREHLQYLQSQSSAETPARLEMCRAVRDGLLPALSASGAEAIWRLQLCSHHLENARRLLAGEPLSLTTPAPTLEGR